jgi:uncharacterized RDD family membrane protein YckC
MCLEGSTGSSTGFSPLPDGVMYSTPGQRFKAYLLDMLLFTVTCGIGWLIWAIKIGPEGWTPGKKMCGMRVISTIDGKTLTLGTLLLRDLVVRGIIGSITAGIGYLWLLWDPNKQNLYDKIMNTHVVNDPEGLTLRPAG